MGGQGMEWQDILVRRRRFFRGAGLLDKENNTDNEDDTHQQVDVPGCKTFGDHGHHGKTGIWLRSAP
jgi:hypothetical protein